MALPETITIPGGFVDLHVHFREPSPVNTSENFDSGTTAALLGGFVEVNDMPNTPKAETWSVARVEEKHDLIVLKARCPVGVYAGGQPESDNLGELAGMIRRCVGTKFYMAPTTNNPYDYMPEQFRDKLVVLKDTEPEKPVMVHPGQNNLEEMVELVAGEFGLPMHACHVNSVEQVEIVRAAKLRGLMATCGVCVHHLAMTSHDAWSRGWKARMQPPLVRQDEAEALFELLADGQIDAVETDHAPHAPEAKEKVERTNPDGDPHDHANTCYGVPGIELAAKVLFYHASLGRISLERIVEVMSTNPARIIGVEFAPNTSVTWDLSKPFEIGKEHVVSGAGWTPFLGMRALGRVLETKISGTPLVNNGKVVGRRGHVVKSRGTVI